MELTLKLEAFEGPLDLLLHLIEKNKVDIYDIPIVEITDQYIDYIHSCESDNLNIMSEFLVMAATLLDIKARMLLPSNEEEETDEDPREELVLRLLEYKLYKSISNDLKDLETDAAVYFYKNPTVPDEVMAYEAPIDLDELTKDVTLDKLESIFQSVINRQRGRVDTVRAGFGTIKKEEISVEQAMDNMVKYARTHKSFSFRQMLNSKASKTQVVVTFLVILEMMKAGDITISQENIFDDIIITSNLA